MVAAGYATRVPCDAIGKEFDDPRICNIARLLRARHWFARRRPACVALAYQALSAVTFCIWHPVVALARRGPVRGPSHLCKRCNQGHRWHRSVVSVQAAHLERRAGLLIIRRSWVRAPPAPPQCHLNNVRNGSAGKGRLHRASTLDNVREPTMHLSSRSFTRALGRRSAEPPLLSQAPDRSSVLGCSRGVVGRAGKQVLLGRWLISERRERLAYRCCRRRGWRPSWQVV